MFCEPERNPLLSVKSFILVCAFSSLSLPVSAINETGYPGRNVNIIGPPPPGSGQPQDLGLRQQNEPSCAVNPENPLQICCGYNDYRGIDIPEIGDAWQGLSCSRDGGYSWNSQLVPGHKADPEFSLNLGFAADPNLVSVPGGLFFNFIAADRDHVGGVYVQRYAWRNKEDSWPLIQVGGPLLISKGTNGRFIDKPHMIGFLDDDNLDQVQLNWSDAQGARIRNLPAGNLGMSAAVFVGNDNNDGTKILYWSSDDWGKTWSNATKLTESKGINSGVNIATNGDNVCVVWRRFDDVNESNSILYACSANRGKTFTKPKLLHEICPFDQATLNGTSSLIGETTPRPDLVSFRSNAFPIIAADGSNFYAFWSDRGFAQSSGFGAGCSLKNAAGGFNPSYGRIVYSMTSNGGKNWSAPKAIDDTEVGHQLMPAAFGANGEVVLSWIDNRDDIANLLDIDKQFIVDFWKADQALYRHTTDIRSTRLKTVGGKVRVAPSVKVSRYTKGLFVSNNQVQLRQLEYNLVNARLFQKGTAPFIGDYLSVTAKAFNKNAAGKWINSNSLITPGTPTFHVTWGDNRDVRGNAWGGADAGGFSAPSPYTPLQPNQVNTSTTNQLTENSSPAVQDPSDDQQIYCDAATVKADRTRDQNVYSAPLYPLTSLSSPGAIKVTGTLQRAFPVFLRNYSNVAEYFHLVIQNQPGDFAQCTGIASFKQYPLPSGNCPLQPEDSIWVKIHSGSSAVRTVFMTSTEEILSSVPVRAYKCASDASGRPDEQQCELVSEVVLNQDLLELGGTLEQPSSGLESILLAEIHNPDLLNPDLLNPDLLNLLIENPDLLNPDLLNPDLLNPDLLNPDLLNPDLLNPDLLNPDLLNPDLLNLILLNPDLLNPDLLNPDLLNPDLLNPDLLNPDLLNLLIDNPDLLNPDLLNPDLLNPDLLNPDLLNAVVSYSDLENPELSNSSVGAEGTSYIDVTWQVKNSGNTTTGYMAQTFIAGPQEHDGTQLIITKPYLRQTIRGCLPVLESDNHVLVNIINPPNVEPVINPDPSDAGSEAMASLWLEPGEMANITLRIFAADASRLRSSRAGMYVNSESCNTDVNCDDKPFVKTTRQADFTGPILTPAEMPDIGGVEASSPDGALVEFIPPTAYDEGDDQTVAVSCLYESGTMLPLGPSENSCSAMDSVGNTTSAVFDVQVVDTTAPELSISLPAEIVFPLEATSPDGAPVYFNGWISVHDEVDVSPSVSCNYESGAVLPIGISILSCIATDASGNYSHNVSIEINIQDSVPPILTSPGAVTVEALAPTGATVIYSVAASDVVDTDLSVQCSPESGQFFAVGLTEIICSVTDDSGNTATEVFFVNVIDSTAPALSLPIGIKVEAVAPEGTAVDYMLAVTASDLVDENVSVDCSPISGSIFPLGINSVNCSATDYSGNTSIGTFTVQVVDTTAPILTLPDNIMVNAMSGSGALVTFTALAVDIVDGTLSVSCMPSSGTEFPVGESSVTCSASDVNGNSVEGSFLVTVNLDIIWKTPVEDPSYDSLGHNLNFRWGYGAGGELAPSEHYLDKPPGKGTEPIAIRYLGESCTGNTMQLVDLDAGKSSLRYRDPEWQLNWQTGQSTLDSVRLRPGCFILEIPRADGLGPTDFKHIILTE